jgi:hypothetical protein
MKTYWEVEVKLYLYLKLADRCTPEEGASIDLWVAILMISSVALNSAEY